MIPTKEQREAWRELAKEGMVSAVGEYTPGEFTVLLDAIDELETENRRLCWRLNHQTDDDVEACRQGKHTDCGA